MRALLDSGSTHTLISRALVELMPEVKAKVVPTSMGFRQVGDQVGRYFGVLPGFHVQLDQNIGVEVNVAVVDTPEPYFIVG